MVKEVKKKKSQKQKSWFLELTKMVLWLLLMLITLILFFELLPVLLLILGESLILFGTSTTPISIVDALIYILVGGSFTWMATKLILKLFKRQYKHVNRIQDDLAGRWSKWYKEWRRLRK